MDRKEEGKRKKIRIHICYISKLQSVALKNDLLFAASIVEEVPFGGNDHFFHIMI